MPTNVISERPSADKIVKEVRIETQRTRGVDPAWELWETAGGQLCRMRLEPSDGSIVFETNDGVGGGWVAAGGSGGLLGDVVGPASAVDNSVARYDGTTGKLLQAGSSAYITDAGNVGINDTSPDDKLHVTVGSADAVECLKLEQLDVSEGFANFVATAAANTTNPITTLTGGNAIQGFVRIEINGTDYWMPYYDAPTS